MKWAVASMISAIEIAGCSTQPKLAPGTFFVDRTGTIKQDVAKHITIFSFDAEPPSDPPLNFVVEPNAKLTLMQSAEPQMGAGGRFRVTAEVTKSNTLVIWRAIIVQPS